MKDELASIVGLLFGIMITIILVFGILFNRRGKRGIQGVQGFDGLDGSDGEQGPQGFTGMQGHIGANGGTGGAVFLTDPTTFLLNLASNSALTQDRTLTFNVNNADRTIALNGNLTLANNFITSGNNSLTLTTTAATNVTLPITGTLATLAGTEVLTNKTITSPIINGTINLPDLTASLPLQLDAGKNVISAAITLSGSQITGVLPIANGGTNSSTALTNGKIMISSAGTIIEGTDKDSPTFSGSNATFGGTITMGNTRFISSATGNIFTIPNVASSNFVMTEGTQTINGTKTFSGITTFSNTTDASSITTGSVVVSGGIGIAKKIYTGSDIVMTAVNAANTGTGLLIGNVISTNNFAGIQNSALSNAVVTNYALIQDTTGNTSVNSPAGTVLSLRNNNVNLMTMDNTAVNFFVPINQTNTTDSSSSTTGSIINAGGLGLGKSLVIGTNATTFGITLNNSTASYVPAVLNYYEEYTNAAVQFNDNGTNISTTTTLKLIRIGKSVTCSLYSILNFLDTAGVRTNIISAAGIIPVRFRTTSDFQHVVRSRSVSDVAAMAIIYANGDIDVAANITGLGTWSAAGNYFYGLSTAWTMN